MATRNEVLVAEVDRALDELRGLRLSLTKGVEVPNATPFIERFQATHKETRDVRKRVEGHLEELSAQKANEPKNEEKSE